MANASHSDLYYSSPYSKEYPNQYYKPDYRMMTRRQQVTTRKECNHHVVPNIWYASSRRRRRNGPCGSYRFYNSCDMSQQSYVEFGTGSFYEQGIINHSIGRSMRS